MITDALKYYADFINGSKFPLGDKPLDTVCIIQPAVRWRLSGVKIHFFVMSLLQFKDILLPVASGAVAHGQLSCVGSRETYK